MVESLTGIGKPESSRMQLYGGIVFDPLDPDPDLITIEAIAHALAGIPRFTAHTNEWYSVAEHSVRVSYACPPRYAYDALMHDTSEFALFDLASPIKHNSPLREPYVELEDRLMTVLAEKFGFTWPSPPAVKKADAVLLATENRDLMSHNDATRALWDPWLVEAPLTQRIHPVGHRVAERQFLSRFHTLYTGDDHER